MVYSLFHVLVDIEHAHAAADGHDICCDFDFFHDLGVLDQVRDLSNAGIRACPAPSWPRRTPLFSDRSPNERLFDKLRDFLLAGRLEVVQFFLERVQTLLTHLISAVDRHNPKPPLYIIEIFVYTI